MTRPIIVTIYIAGLITAAIVGISFIPDEWITEIVNLFQPVRYLGNLIDIEWLITFISSCYLFLLPYLLFTFIQSSKNETYKS